MLPHLNEYYLSDKADGERCFAFFKNNNLSIITTTTIKHIELKQEVPVCILDCEVLELDKSPRLYAFDILYWKNPCTKPTTESRFEIMHEAIKELSKVYKLLEEKIQIRIKNRSDIKEMFTRKAMYPIDGLVFTPASGMTSQTKRKTRFSSPHNYFDMTVFKWKPPERQTIDFLVMKCPKNILGQKPYLSKPKHTLYFLFNGVQATEFKRLGLRHPPEYNTLFNEYTFRPGFFPTTFQPSSDPYAYLCWIPDSLLKTDIHGHVAEFGWDFDSENRWIFHTLRPDRDTQVSKGLGFGNSYKVAEIIYNGYKNPFTMDHLINPENYKASVYFSQTKEEIYKPLTKFNAFVKAQTMIQLEKAQRVIDAAGGKGQDLFTLHGYGVRELHIMDIDKEAIAQIDKRKYNLGDKKLYVFDFHPDKRFQLSTQVADLSKPASELVDLAHFHPGTVDGIIMNFAIHYIVHGDDSLQNLIDFVDTMLRSKGIFIFTCFDGQRVFDLLKSTKQGESVDLNIDDPRAQGETRKKYSIRKLYNEKKFIPNGLKISAIHPFSDQSYYEESLIGIQWILAAFRKRKYTVLQYGSFGDLLGKYDKFNPTWSKKMSDHDKLYSSLYSYVTVLKS